MLVEIIKTTTLMEVATTTKMAVSKKTQMVVKLLQSVLTWKVTTAMKGVHATKKTTRRSKMTKNRKKTGVVP